MTTLEAVQQYPGADAVFLSRMCLKGKVLTRRYGGASRVPAKEKAAVLFAKKVSARWFIPVSELDRVFLPAPE